MNIIDPSNEGVKTPPDPECECWPTPEETHYVYYGITEPGSAWEWNPDCPAHPPRLCDCTVMPDGVDVCRWCRGDA